MSNDNVVILDVETSLDIPVERVLEGGKGLRDVIVIGYDEDNLEYFASSCADIKNVVWLLERTKLCLLRMADSPQ